MRAFTLPLLVSIALANAGCEALPERDDVAATSSNWLSRSGEVISAQGQRLSSFASGLAGGGDDGRAERREEVDALLAQPYIDPITRFIESRSDDPAYQDALRELADERARRCQEVARRYADLEPTRDNLERYRGGYLYSCPADVSDFSARVLERQGGVALSGPEEQRQAESASEDNASAEPESVEQAMDRRQLNDCYLYFTIRNFQQAREACADPAEAGDAKAQHHLGRMDQLDGNGRAATEWARRSAEQRHPPGMLLLGDLLSQERPEEALRWRRRAADAGLSAAMLAMGHAYRDGEGTSRDLEEAHRWWRLAEEKGESDARALLEDLERELTDEQLGRLRRNGSDAEQSPDS